jgi:hypothetical protein
VVCVRLRCLALRKAVLVWGVHVHSLLVIAEAAANEAGNINCVARALITVKSVEYSLWLKL